MRLIATFIQYGSNKRVNSICGIQWRMQGSQYSVCIWRLMAVRGMTCFKKSHYNSSLRADTYGL